MSCNVPRGAENARTARQLSCTPPLLRSSHELLVPLVRTSPQSHLGRRPLRTPVVMPAPTPTLSLDDVRRFVEEHVFTPPEGSGAEGRVGIELEWIPVPRDGDAPPAPAALAALLPSTLPGASRVTFEPGGQLELSGPPGRDLGAACTAMRADTACVREALDRAGIDLIGTGLDGRGDRPRVLDAPRYHAMEQYFDAHWPAGRTMMRHSA